MFRKAAELRKAQEALDAELRAIEAQTSDLDDADRTRLADLLAGRQVMTLATGGDTTAAAARIDLWHAWASQQQLHPNYEDDV